MRRVESLDYLRGIMAISVMLYHYTSWTLGTLGGEYLLGKFGIYAVSIFYILSGLSLTIVYQDKIKSRSDIASFIVKRMFRIFPLFWLVVTLFLILKALSSAIGIAVFDVTFYKIFLNYSLLFGFVEPAAYLSTGAWSIGNEMVFYAIFPLIFFLANRSTWLLPLSIVLSFIIGGYFAFVEINEMMSLREQWAIYVNPFNQIFLFMAGVAIGKWGKYLLENISNLLGYCILIAVFILFWLYPADGDKVQIVTGIQRVVLSLSSIIFVLFVFVLNPIIKSTPNKVLAFFGQSSYSIYLLHPLVSITIVFICSKLGIDKPMAYLLSFLVTLVVSWLTFKYIEKPMMIIGKTVSNKINYKSI